jgi:hypothetical protein
MHGTVLLCCPRMPARPYGTSALGAWPAFWLLPNTDKADCLGCGDFGGWCSSGEVDILETRNADGLFQSTVVYGGLKDAGWLGCDQRAGGWLTGLLGGWPTHPPLPIVALWNRTGHPRGIPPISSSAFAGRRLSHRPSQPAGM